MNSHSPKKTKMPDERFWSHAGQGWRRLRQSSWLLIACCALFMFMAALPFSPVRNGGLAPAFAQAFSTKHVTPTLIADTTALVPGKAFRLGIDLKMDPGWHTYYKESGEAGQPTKVTWTLPQGFKASELLWQKPLKFSDAGITTYGYHDHTLVGADLTAPADIKPGDKLTFKADVTWLACKDVCMPGEGTVTLTLPVSNEAKPANADDFSKLGFSGPLSGIGGSGSGAVGGQGGKLSSGGASRFTGDILNSTLKVQGGSDQGMNLAAYLGLALVGGFILNFMPCVLPVISIKVLSFMQQAGDDPKRVFNMGLIFSAGIISAFMCLAALVAGIEAAGQKIGWGFQFQFPIFLLGMSAIVLVLALSLFGVIYFQVSAGQNEIDKLAQKEGATGTFFKGVLATTLSTPCSAPFLGTALGFAFSQPMWVVALIFFTIGLGMAAPYIVLTAKPEWMRYLPKPGAWMEKFKESMGFLLVATVIWLLWVLAQQVGINAAMSAAGFLTVLSFAVWMCGRFVSLVSDTKRKATVYSIAGATLLAGYVFFLAPFPQLLSFSPAVQSDEPQPLTDLSAGSAAQASNLGGTASSARRIKWQPFTIDTLNEQLKAGKTVVVDFTADWCLTCKVNEATVINTAPVIEKFDALHVVPLRADWTKQDPTISKLLQKFGRSGVPLYVIFPANRPTEPIVLPEVITQGLVLQKLDEAGSSH